MDAAGRIAWEFDRLSRLPRRQLSHAERLIWLVVTVRCAADIGGFSSVFEQTIAAEQLEELIAGLDRLGEPNLSSEFTRCREVLERTAYPLRADGCPLPDGARLEIEAIGDRVGDRLWDLDPKLAALLDGRGE